MTLINYWCVVRCYKGTLYHEIVVFLIINGDFLHVNLVVYQPADQPMGEDNDKNGDDSQEIVFSLHLTQSQVDMNSQMPMDDDIQEVCQRCVLPYSTWQHNEHKVPQNTQSAYMHETLSNKQAFSSLTPCLK